MTDKQGHGRTNASALRSRLPTSAVRRHARSLSLELDAHLACSRTADVPEPAIVDTLLRSGQSVLGDISGSSWPPDSDRAEAHA